jgi:hypothetical protein
MFSVGRKEQNLHFTRMELQRNYYGGVNRNSLTLQAVIRSRSIELTQIWILHLEIPRIQDIGGCVWSQEVQIQA